MRSGGMPKADGVQHGPRNANGIVTGWPGPRARRAPSLAEQQTIEDALRALTRILYAAVERRHDAPALDINIGTRY